MMEIPGNVLGQRKSGWFMYSLRRQRYTVLESLGYPDSTEKGFSVRRVNQQESDPLRDRPNSDSQTQWVR